MVILDDIRVQPCYKIWKNSEEYLPDILHFYTHKGRMDVLWTVYLQLFNCLYVPIIGIYWIATTCMTGALLRLPHPSPFSGSQVTILKIESWVSITSCWPLLFQNARNVILSSSTDYWMPWWQDPSTLLLVMMSDTDLVTGLWWGSSLRMIAPDSLLTKPPEENSRKT